MNKKYFLSLLALFKAVGGFFSEWYSASVCDMKKVDFLFDVLVSF